MGVSTNGLLFYGILLEEDEGEFIETIHPMGNDFDIEDYIMEKYGFTMKWEEGEDNEDYYNKRFKVKATIPCIILTHCSYDYPLYYLALKKANYSASRGNPEEVNFSLPPDADDTIKKFCDKVGIPYSKPKWYLASLWG